MTRFEDLHKCPRRPFRTFIGSSTLAMYVLGPFIMLWCYYNALKGNITFIVISLVQIIGQLLAKKSRLYLNFIQMCDVELYFNDWTFESKEPIIDDSKSLFAAHPHGIFSLGLFLNNKRDNFGKNAAVCGSRLVTLAPIMGLIHKWGGMVSVNADSLKAVMKQGRNIGLLPGGFEEATISTSKENRVFVKERKGFIKYAIRYGYKVFPVFTFGENKMYNTVERFQTLRLWLNNFKLVGAIFWSKYGIFPDINSEIHTVVGNAIILPQEENPSNETVDKYHQIYIEKLTSLYEEYSVKYNVKDELKIF